MVGSQGKPRATASDLLGIPEAHRFHEILCGELVQKAMPSAKHGNAQGALVAELRGPFNRKPGGPRPGGWWILTEVQVSLEEHEVFRPDLVGWRRERMADLPAETPIALRPDWVCEVLSPANKRNDTVHKRPVYHRAGVPHYWIVDPDEETLDVYRRHEDGYLLLLTAERTDRVRAEPFEAFLLKVSVLFGDDADDESQD